MKVLGLDLGTNSIGWGIVNEKSNTPIQNCGVYIFPEGVKIEKKGNEQSKAAERTKFRSARRLKFRRKLRKYETLKVLINNNMCPLTMEELENWRQNDVYPNSEAFINWYRTDENNHWEPYYLRKKCVEEKADNFETGRALYHITQRRGFLSNRKESTKGGDDGKVKAQIGEISEKKGNLTLGQYFYNLKQDGEKVRAKYTSRKAHYEEEFNKICEVQQISGELKEQLYKAIFFQRKLKSQKALVGKCTFERDKPRCPISHFEFEEFRMLSFINNIKVKRNEDEDDNQPETELTSDEKESIKELFFRKSKSNFTFKDIHKKLAKKHEYWKFNYRDDTSIAACPTITRFKEIFGSDWQNTQIANYDIFDIWHVLFDFDSNEKVYEFASQKLKLDDEKTKLFCDITFPQGYANLSLKAIRKILPFLRDGHIYTKAVFLANIPAMIGKEFFERDQKTIVSEVMKISDNMTKTNLPVRMANICLDYIIRDTEHDFRSEDWNRSFIDKCIKDYVGKSLWNDLTSKEQAETKAKTINLIEDTLRILPSHSVYINDFKPRPYHIDDLITEYLKDKGYTLKKGVSLYHPSETESAYHIKKAVEQNGKKYLPSPMTDSIKNPVVMRAMHQLRKLVNYLIATGEIDENTRIHIELAKEVNDKNKRKAIADFQTEQEKKNTGYRKAIEETAAEHGIKINVTDDDIKKYRLWTEQNEECPYTGKHISFTELFGDNPQFDFEHTVPRSLSYDDSLENLTLCHCEFNRNVKKQQLPSQLAAFDEILRRFERYYEDKIDKCLAEIERNKLHGGYIDPESKDKKIVARHIAKMKLDYYIGKLKRFRLTEVTEGFKNSQLNDTRIITKFAKDYLKRVFDYVRPVNGSITDTFKHQWGLMKKGEKKDRSSHIHHAVDAIVVASVDKWKYDSLCKHIHESPDGSTINLPKPWPTFKEDVLKATSMIIPKIYSDDNSLRQTKKVKKDRNGKTMYVMQGNTARGSLHLDTFYGCIMTPPEKDKPSEKLFVQTVSCKYLVEKKAEKIIDRKLRETYFSNIKNGIQDENSIKQDGIKLPYKLNGKDVYAKKIRIKAKPSNPIKLKEHNNNSNKNLKEYKQIYYVANDENYLVATYRKGTKKDYIVLNLLDAIKNKINGADIYPQTLNKGTEILEFYRTIKIKQVLILKDSDSEDVLNLPSDKLYQRIYVVIGIESGGPLKLRHISVAKPWPQGVKNSPISIYSDFRRPSVNSLHFLSEGTDFRITPSGKIEKI